jgi:hypothetical protein|tara:strand:+ start:25 stop:186 length:162 start_codon:yes stop_codon:yes gene_type:complete
MDYLESSRGIKITRSRALKELRDHGVMDYQIFFKELGNKKNYKAFDVLKFLEY